MKAKLPSGKMKLRVYVMENTSHPLILGMQYLKSKKVQVNFADTYISFTHSIRNTHAFDMSPNTREGVLCESSIVCQIWYSRYL